MALVISVCLILIKKLLNNKKLAYRHIKDWESKVRKAKDDIQATSRLLVKLRTTFSTYIQDILRAHGVEPCEEVIEQLSIDWVTGDYLPLGIGMIGVHLHVKKLRLIHKRIHTREELLNELTERTLKGEQWALLDTYAKDNYSVTFRDEKNNQKFIFLNQEAYSQLAIGQEINGLFLMSQLIGISFTGINLTGISHGEQ
jgi:hypothetical protein